MESGRFFERNNEDKGLKRNEYIEKILREKLDPDRDKK